MSEYVPGHVPQAGWQTPPPTPPPTQTQAPPQAPLPTQTLSPTAAEAVIAEDRSVLPNLAWEGVLLPIAVIMIVLASLDQAFGFAGPWYPLAETGLAASGIALSLRTGTPNLAVGGIVAGSGAVYVKLLAVGTGVIPAMAVVVLVALAFGAVMGVVTGLTRLPAWAVSVAGLAGTQAAVIALIQSRPAAVAVEHWLFQDAGVPWFVLFVVVSVGGAGLWLLPGVRQALAPSAEQAGSARVRGAVVGLAGSSALAGLAGVLIAGRLGTATGLEGNLPVVLGAALLGGASVFGRRAGVAGTVLGTTVVTTVVGLLQFHRAGLWMVYLAGTLAMLLGLGVSWVLDLVSRPPAAQPSHRMQG